MAQGGSHFDGKRSRLGIGGRQWRLRQKSAPPPRLSTRYQTQREHWSTSTARLLFAAVAGFVGSASYRQAAHCLVAEPTGLPACATRLHRDWPIVHMVAGLHHIKARKGKIVEKGAWTEYWIKVKKARTLAPKKPLEDLQAAKRFPSGISGQLRGLVETVSRSQHLRGGHRGVAFTWGWG